MNLIADGGHLVHHLDDFLVEVGRVRAGKANPAYSRDPSYLGQELWKTQAGRQRVDVGIDVLAEKEDFDIAVISQPPDLFQNEPAGAILFPTPGEGDYAEGAEF